MTDFETWLTTTLEAIVHINNENLLSKIDGSILHICLSANALKDNFNLNLTGEQLSMLWKLATIIDLDYGISFDV